jgi:TBC1 domain family protein 5
VTDTNHELVVEANYSMALMLLLKYPAPASPHGPHTFVDDAIFLRENFSAAGGAKVISRYGADPPPIPPFESQPGTPLAMPTSPRYGFARQMSPLPSPARFLQQQGGVEGLFRGAAKGVLERGERLGINQAVRDAVGEVRQNMQGLQVSRSNSMRQEDARWSLDEGKSITSSRASIATMNIRNKQLARMLDQAMGELRLVSSSKEASTAKYAEAMDIAIAKVDFVKIYLEDATMPLPPDSPIMPLSSPPAETEKPQLLLPETVPNRTQPSSKPSITSQHSGPEKEDHSNNMALKEAPSTEDLVLGKSKENAKSEYPPEHEEDKAAHAGLLAIRPKPMPTRSTIAQS